MKHDTQSQDTMQSFKEYKKAIQKQKNTSKLSAYELLKAKKAYNDTLRLFSCELQDKENTKALESASNIQERDKQGLEVLQHKQDKELHNKDKLKNKGKSMISRMKQRSMKQRVRKSLKAHINLFTYNSLMNNTYSSNIPNTKLLQKRFKDLCLDTKQIYLKCFIEYQSSFYMCKVNVNVSSMLLFSFIREYEKTSKDEVKPLESISNIQDKERQYINKRVNKDFVVIAKIHKQDYQKALDMNIFNLYQYSFNANCYKVNNLLCKFNYFMLYSKILDKC
ncbi:hypothetical protein CQA53_08980 [Helicobacter didelphidarum]|uniref:Uncharacterized protein n=1 Tax=Helicobacter didelphidarum TaxID=2040648 RepID=A0A3D8IE75_9HELI|nr:hypothetical protein [Helicobacter didelphidarum]RDU62831.1 hypothetical protein CQA53_08980 [Helicobacter didelphidarum]